MEYHNEIIILGFFVVGAAVFLFAVFNLAILPLIKRFKYKKARKDNLVSVVNILGTEDPEEWKKEWMKRAKKEARKKQNKDGFWYFVVALFGFISIVAFVSIYTQPGT